MKVIQRRRRIGWLSLGLAGLLCASYAYWTLGRPLPPLQAHSRSMTIQASATAGNLAWPLRGQAAVSIMGMDFTETHGQQVPVPIASTAKLITALTVLHDKPLKLNESGPIVTLNTNDIALYQAYVARGGSAVPVAIGEQISQYQMLQAILIPSANNLADSLAIWCYGSLNAYTEKANAYMRELGLSGTTVGKDASGLDPTTTSTARDLLKLGELAMKNPVIAQIVGQSSAEGLPVANTIRTTNSLLGNDNVIGIKTGTSDEAGGVFVSASRITLNGKLVTIITAIVGETNKQAVMAGSQALIRSTQANFKPVRIMKAGTAVGHYDLPWGGSVSAVAARDLTVKVWAGGRVEALANLQPLKPTAGTNHRVGTLKLSTTALYASQAVPLTVTRAPTQPTMWWRLTHPGFFL